MSIGPQDVLATAVASGAMVVLVRRVLGFLGPVSTPYSCACAASASCRRHLKPTAPTAPPGALIQIIVPDRQPDAPLMAEHGRSFRV
jgi:hypothetical protein